MLFNNLTLLRLYNFSPEFWEILSVGSAGHMSEHLVLLLYTSELGPYISVTVVKILLLQSPGCNSYTYQYIYHFSVGVQRRRSGFN